MEATPQQVAYRPQEAAKAIGVSKATIHELIRSGRIPAYKHGHKLVLIDADDLRAFVKSGTPYLDQ